jgi:NADH pyrophosphatase NudC (nudix superfamily)
VSLVIEDGDRVLLVRRPADDHDLPGVWGLPAATVAEGESEQDAVRRAGREKLGVDLRPLEAVGSDGFMTDFRAEIVTGEPAVQRGGTNTQYVEVRWGGLHELVPAARAGSLCSRVLLRARGVGWGDG